MSDSLPSPPLSRDASPAASATPSTASYQDLSLRLDHLLEQYLEFLEQYSSLRKDLSTQFAEGFFSLARARRSSNVGSGQRYGEDGFDQRMKALSRVKIGRNDTSTSTCGTTDDSQKSVSTFTCYCNEDALTKTPTNKKPASDGGDENVSDNDKSIDIKIDDNVHKQDSTDPGLRDPATWYGVLIPQMLRQTQLHFTKSVTHSIPSLLSVQSSMFALEQEIRDLRARIAS